MTVTLIENSFELDGYVFGGVGAPQVGSRVVIERVDFGTPELATTDVARPRADGTVFGRDYFGAREITFELVVLTEPTQWWDPSALDTLAALQRAWQADTVRAAPGAVSTLRYRLGQRQRQVYGRGRKFAYDTDHATAGRIPVTATFACTDHLFYDDVQFTNTVGYVPPPAGGLTFPAIFPWGTVAVGYSPGVITVTGQAPAWLVVVIYGPIAYPSVRWVQGDWQLDLDLVLAYGEYVVIDPRPWSRGVRFNGTANVAGALAPTSPRLSQMWLPADAVHEIVLGGRDDTGTSSMMLAWRPSYVSP